MSATDSIILHPAVTLALQQSETHSALASKATTEAERRAHLSTVRALNKAAMEMVRGNIPQAVGDGQYLVNSRTNAGTVYRVDVYAQACDCANQHACWHLAACSLMEEIKTRDANDGDLLPQGARDLLAETDGELDSIPF